ncbi:MAG TPA: alpha-L-fucosidase [Fimbriimonadaceae bacterium]|nr:alpha-L-fucosidase [Fimbriimonadaceae bacterium]
MIQDWFLDAKLGIFIHWGIYAVDGIAESWAFFNGTVSHEEYTRQLDGFTAERWDPDAWAALFARSGARYVVLTSKHHDGVALWDTRASDLSVVKKTPAGRDLIRPYLDALRRHGLRAGLYFSHLDWTHPDYASIGSDDPKANPFAFRQGATDPDGWGRFLEFHRAQLKELCTEYGPIDLLWFDGDWERDAQTWHMAELREQLHGWQPEVVLNSRMQGYGDYKTPEQGMPIVAPEGPWEFCMTINDSWGYQGSDRRYKSPQIVLQTFCETIGMGGNLLLDVGPMEDGTIPPEQVEVLEHLGRWIGRHAESVYGTRAGLPFGHFWGPSTLSQDRSRLYLMILGHPRGQVCLRGLKNAVTRATALGSGAEVGVRRLGGADWMQVPGVLWLDVPPDALEPEITVLRLELEGPLDLYRGGGQGV